MPARNLDAVFYVETPPVLELRDGLIHVSFAISKACQLEVVLPKRTFLTALRKSNKLSDLIHDGGAEVIALHR